LVLSVNYSFPQPPAPDKEYGYDNIIIIAPGKESEKEELAGYFILKLYFL